MTVTIDSVREHDSSAFLDWHDDHGRFFAGGVVWTPKGLALSGDLARCVPPVLVPAVTEQMIRLALPVEDEGAQALRVVEGDEPLRQAFLRSVDRHLKAVAA